MKKWQKLSLVLIFLIALGFRLWNVGSHPTFISDEASIGYNAYSVLKTGRDEWGEILPFSFKSFGEYKLPLYIYLTVPSIFVFGLNEFAVRLPSVAFGSLTVLLVFFLVKEFLGGKKKVFPAGQFLIPFLVTLFLALNPWHIQVSRMALEANLGLFLTVLAVFFLLRARCNPKLYYISFSIFALTLYTYNSCRIFTPLFLLAYFFITRRDIRFRSIFRPAIFAFLLVLPLIFSGFVGSRERIYKVSIFTDPGIIAQINQKRGDCQKTAPDFVCLLVYNKPVVYSQTFFKNYLSHFSWKFLFKDGAGLAQYGVPGQGMLYFWELPLILIGAVYLIKQSDKFAILALWLLIAPLANSFTGLAHPVRAILMLPVWQIFSALGIYSLTSFLRKRIFFKFIHLPLLFLILVASMGGFVVKYFFYYPRVSDWNWQMGYKSLYQKLAQLETNYDRIYVSKFYGEPHIFYLFYNKYDPRSYQENREVIKYDREDLWTNVDRIGKYEFVQDPQEVSLSDKDLLVVPLQQFPFKGKIIDVVRYNNDSVAFLVLANER